METSKTPLLQARNFGLTGGGVRILSALSLDVEPNEILGIIGPAGSGKTSFLRSLNRLNDLVPGFRSEGDIFFHGRSILGAEVNVVELRRAMGMVFATPVPLPRSIFENIVFGARLSGVRGAAKLRDLAEESLVRAGLWDEVRDRLDESALNLSGGQQQRLCIARVLAVQPDVLLMDEPCSAIDPTSVQKVEDLMAELKSSVTIIIVTHNMQQAARVSDETAFFLQEKQGEAAELIEFGRTAEIFTSPHDRRTEDYITGRFG